VATGSGVLGGGVFVDGQYIRVLIETGLLGLTAFLVLLAVMWRRARTAYQTLRVPWHRGFALGYLAGLAGLMFHALAANSFIIVRIMEPFFILTALMFRLPDLEKSESAPNTEEV
jgi:O-antigen ligase